MTGCYYCLHEVDMSKVTHFVDDGKTPICPHCGIDAVTDVKSKGDLEKLNEKFFGDYE